MWLVAAHRVGGAVRGIGMPCPATQAGSLWLCCLPGCDYSRRKLFAALLLPIAAAWLLLILAVAGDPVQQGA